MNESIERTDIHPDVAARLTSFGPHWLQLERAPWIGYWLVRVKGGGMGVDGPCAWVLASGEFLAKIWSQRCTFCHPYILGPLPKMKGS